ncbi:hypothetical protein JW930_06015 [Candidatus Woesearchaeota archaeon]|nr:hypothetical protein [Candidatus Woesearchaeota archaeon]
MEHKEKNNLMYISIVAVVAIVAIFGLVVIVRNNAVQVAPYGDDTAGAAFDVSREGGGILSACSGKPDGTDCTVQPSGYPGECFNGQCNECTPTDNPYGSQCDGHHPCCDMGECDTYNGQYDVCWYTGNCRVHDDCIQGNICVNGQCVYGTTTTLPETVIAVNTSAFEPAIECQQFYISEVPPGWTTVPGVTSCSEVTGINVNINSWLGLPVRAAIDAQINHDFYIPPLTFYMPFDLGTHEVVSLQGVYPTNDKVGIAYDYVTLTQGARPSVTTDFNDCCGSGHDYIELRLHPESGQADGRAVESRKTGTTTYYTTGITAGTIELRAKKGISYDFLVHVGPKGGTVTLFADDSQNHRKYCTCAKWDPPHPCNGLIWEVPWDETCKQGASWDNCDIGNCAGEKRDQPSVE